MEQKKKIWSVVDVFTPYIHKGFRMYEDTGICLRAGVKGIVLPRARKCKGLDRFNIFRKYPESGTTKSQLVEKGWLSTFERYKLFLATHNWK